MPNGVQLAAWDGRTDDGWGALADGAGAIVNLAGENLAEGRWTADRKRRILDSRVDAARAVVEAVENAASKPEVVVQASAVGYYGPRGTEPVDEQAQPGSDFLAGVCLAAEGAVTRLRELGVRVPVARTGIVLSADGGALPRMAMPFKLFVGGPLGSGRQAFPWIHIDDEIAALEFLISHDGADGPYNLTAPTSVTNAEFSSALGRTLGRPALLPVPSFALQLAFGEMSTALLDGQRAVPTRLQEAGFEFAHPETDAALRDLLA